MYCTPYCIYSNSMFVLPGMYASSVGMNYFAFHTLLCGIASNLYHLHNEMRFKALDVILAKALFCVTCAAHVVHAHALMQSSHYVVTLSLLAASGCTYKIAGTHKHSTTYSFYHTLWHAFAALTMLSWLYGTHKGNVLAAKKRGEKRKSKRSLTFSK